MASAFTNIRIAGGDTAKPLAMAKRLDLIGRHLRPSARRFLDCGCGSGAYVAALMKQFGLDAHGIEFDEEKVKTAWSKFGLRDRIVRGDLQAVDAPESTFDYVMLNEVLEHVPNDRAALEECYRLLKPNGLLFLFSPNRWFPFETHGVRLARSGRRVPHWIPFIPYVPLPLGKLFFEYWARNYWQRQLADMVKASRFSIIERAFVWLTFEDISGYQPGFIRVTKPLIRRISDQLEKFPVVKRFGVTQVLVCRK